MIRGAMILLLTLSGLAMLVLGLVSRSTPMTGYPRSTDRYCLRWQFHGGRVSLLYDGGPEVIGPLEKSWSMAGFELTARSGGWQVIEASVPIWAPVGLTWLYPSIALIRIPLDRRRRRLLGLCRRCGYSLIGNTTGICPECGSKIDPAMLPRLQSLGGVERASTADRETACMARLH